MSFFFNVFRWALIWFLLVCSLEWHTENNIRYKLVVTIKADNSEAVHYSSLEVRVEFFLILIYAASRLTISITACFSAS